MQFRVEFKPKAIKELQSLPNDIASRILDKISALQDNLHGDVKKLTNHSPEYRLRIGNYRVLFDIADNTVFIYRVLHRREAYQ
jgi:mRNA interferase RelE/StbE